MAAKQDDLTNRIRAKRIRDTLTELYEYEDAQTVLIDVLTDLRHLADADRLNFSECDRIALQHYTEESGNENRSPL